MLGFIYQLRDAGIPVGTQSILEFFSALRRGLAPDVDRLFLLSRLVFVKRVEHYHAFEQVFRAFFFGEGAGTGPEPADLELERLEEWLRRQVEAGALTQEEAREFDREELLAEFRKVLAEQEGEHHHGGSWIGTGGDSPFGHGGTAPGGLRVHGEGMHGSAQMLIGRRRYVDYAESSPLASENLRQVLAALKGLRPVGPESELDVDATIDRTAKSGGEIELVFRRELRSRLKIMVIMDNGGDSMTPFVRLVRAVFNRIKDMFEDLHYYYFHNCIYGIVYDDAPRTKPVRWRDLVEQPANTRVILIGDANMAPAELMAAAGTADVTDVKKPGLEWLRELRERFPVSVWLNPIPAAQWPAQSPTLARIASVFPMEELTLAGIKRAVEYLNEQGRVYDRLGQ